MYLTILNYPLNSVEILLYNDIEGSNEEDFDINDWITLNYSDQVDYMISDFLNISI
jgi:hypothetical protein